MRIWVYTRSVLEAKIEALATHQKRNPGAKSRRSTPKWDWLSSTVALLLFVDVCAFTGYLWALPETFAQSSKVISTVASWVVSVLGFIGVKKATRRTSLPKFLHLPPVVLCTLAFTAGVWMFVLPFHAISLSVIAKNGNAPLPRATVAVDGKPPSLSFLTSDGRIHVGNLLAATHNLKVECDGYLPELRSAGLADVLWGGHLLVALGRAKGLIDARTTPAAADVFLDGDSEHTRGITPLPLEVDSGAHTIRFAKSGFRSTEWEPIEVRPGDPKLVERTLVRIPLPPAKEYRVLFESLPEGAAVFVDGSRSGDTPFALQLAAGRHTVKYRLGNRDCGAPETITVPPTTVPKSLEACGK